MEKTANEIRVKYSDPRISDIIKKIGDEEPGYSAHFNQNEEFFISIAKIVEVPHLPIHHDVRDTKPSERYLDGLADIVTRLSGVVPELLKNLTYFFDPGEILHPCFYQIFRAKDYLYLYLLRLDLSFRIHEAEMTEAGNNDITPAFATRNIFLESSLIPLEKVTVLDGRVLGFIIKQTISQTWIGETGRGYFIQGIWMDHELTKFFSKLFIPNGKRIYPYYPFTCKYRTICHTVLDLSPGGRVKHLPFLHKALSFTAPNMERIQKSLKNETFTPDLSIYRELKQEIPPYWEEIWKDLTVSPYLNGFDMKEFKVGFSF